MQSCPRPCADCRQLAGMAAVAPVVVVGGGVIGCSVALYLARAGRAVVLLEGERMACAASGKAGGYLARHQTSSVAIRALMEQSFDLHTQLAAELGGPENYGYRQVEALSIHFGAGMDHRQASEFDDDRPLTRPGWLADGVEVVRCPRTSEGTAAQCHPEQLTVALAAAAEVAGAIIVVGEAGRVVSVATTDGAVTAVGTADGGHVPCGELVLCAGPWSAHILRMVEGVTPRYAGAFPLAGRLSHSIVVRPKTSGVLTEPFAMFIDDRSLAVAGADPDLYFRPKEEVYISGEALMDHTTPPRESDIVKSQRCVDRLQHIATLSPHLATVVGNAPLFPGAIVPEQSSRSRSRGSSRSRSWHRQSRRAAPLPSCC